jgi:hypothetical protein
MESNPDVMKSELSTLKKHYKEQNKKLKELELYKEIQETSKSIRKIVDKLTLLSNEVVEHHSLPSIPTPDNLVLPTPTFINKTKTKKTKK